MKKKKIMKKLKQIEATLDIIDRRLPPPKTVTFNRFKPIEKVALWEEGKPQKLFEEE